MSFPFGADAFIPDPEASFTAGGELISIVMPRPSDFHNHFRLGALRQAITPAVSWPYKHVLAMPNTGNKADGTNHIYTLADAKHYRKEVLAILAEAGITTTNIVMTIYLSPETTVEMIEEIADYEFPVAVKAYPPNATTGSGEAVSLLDRIDILKVMARLGVRLLIHGESTHDVDGNQLAHKDREGYFYTHVYPKIRKEVPDLLICLEHITTAIAVGIVKADTSGRTVCTITPQHGLFDVSVFDEVWGGAHARCMPYPKTKLDVIVVRTFMTSGDPRVILGTDCAPHVESAKNKPFEEAACGCYTPHAMAMYAQIFYECNALDSRFVRFACTNGPDWWGLDRPEWDDTIELRAVANGVPEPTPVPELHEVVIPLGWTSDPTTRMPLHIESVPSS